jgi:hypothetical protein
MSDDYVGPDLGADHEGYDVNAGHENFDLDHGQQAFGSDQDHNLNLQQFGAADSHEADQHYAQGHEVEYDNPGGAHYAEQDFTNFDGHEADSSAAFANSLNESDHNEAFGQLETLHEELESGHFDAEGFRGLEEGGQSSLNAASN